MLKATGVNNYFNMSAIAFLTAVALAKACSEGRFLNLTIMKKLERSEMKNLKGGY